MINTHTSSQSINISPSLQILLPFSQCFELKIPPMLHQIVSLPQTIYKIHFLSKESQMILRIIPDDSFDLVFPSHSFINSLSF